MTETPCTFDAEGVTLEGVLHRPAGDGPFPAVVVCHPHPLYGGNMRNNVVMAAVAGLTSHGVAALRFNFRGVDGSGGVHDQGLGEQADVRAALACLRAQDGIDPARVALAGYSFGARMAATVVTTDVPALALIALPLRGGPPAALAAYAGPLLLAAGDSDQVCPADDLAALAAERGGDTHLRIVPEADHGWWGFEDELAAIVGEFFGGRLT